MPTDCPTRIKLHWQGWVALLILLTLICLIGLRRPPLPEVVILPLPEPKPTRLQNMIEYGWSWLQFHLPGHHRQSVLLRAKVFRFDRRPEAVELPLPSVAASTNGIRVWLLPEQQTRVLNKALEQVPGAEVISQGAIQTLSRMRGSMAAGNTVVVDGSPKWVGMELNSFPRIRKDNIDLDSRVQFTEAIKKVAHQISVRTNFAMRSRMQIPKAGGAFIVGDPKDGKPIGVLLSATVQ